MPDTPTPQAQSEAAEQQKAKRTRLDRAFLSVFGSPRKRNAEQRLVMDCFEEASTEDENSFNFKGADGIASIAAGIHRDGAKSFYRIINRKIARAEESEEQKPRHTVKR